MHILDQARMSACQEIQGLRINLANFNFLSRKVTMKVRASIKADPSKGDKVVRRKGRVYVINKKDPNRKQRQKGPARKK